jgi:hypothetical protein
VFRALKALLVPKGSKVGKVYKVDRVLLERRVQQVPKGSKVFKVLKAQLVHRVFRVGKVYKV